LVHAALTPEAERSNLLAHSELGHHAAGHLGRALEVVGRTGRDLAKDELLGYVAAQGTGDGGFELGLRPHVSVLLGCEARVATRYSPGNDRHLVHRIGLRQGGGDQSMTSLVIRGDSLFALAEHA